MCVYIYIYIIYIYIYIYIIIIQDEWVVDRLRELVTDLLHGRDDRPASLCN